MARWELPRLPVVRGTEVGDADGVGGGGGEVALELEDRVVLGAEVTAALDGEGRVGEGGAAVL